MWAAGQAKCLCQVSGQTHGHRVACGRTTIVLQSGQCLLRLTTQKKRLKLNACYPARTLFRCSMNLNQQVRGAGQDSRVVSARPGKGWVFFQPKTNSAAKEEATRATC